jgi:hypothetical protein
MAGTLVVDTIQSGASGTIIPTIKSTSTTAPTIFQNSAGTEIGTLCRAWVNWDGSTGTGNTIRASFNVSSVTRVSLGIYTITFDNPMVDASYCANVSGQSNGNDGRCESTIYNTNGTSTMTASTVTVRYILDATAANRDVINGCVSVFR